MQFPLKEKVQGSNPWRPTTAPSSSGLGHQVFILKITGSTPVGATKYTTVTSLSVHEKLYNFCPTCRTKLERVEVDSRKRLHCPRCDFIFWNNPKPVVSALIHRSGEVLLLQRTKAPLKGYWCLPGGYINYDETPEKAVRREVNEEIGLELKIEGLIGVYRIDNDPRGVNIDVIYQGTANGGIRLSGEHTTHRFFPTSQLPQKIAYKHKEAIANWNDLTEKSPKHP